MCVRVRVRTHRDVAHISRGAAAQREMRNPTNTQTDTMQAIAPYVQCIFDEVAVDCSKISKVDSVSLGASYAALSSDDLKQRVFAANTQDDFMYVLMSLGDARKTISRAHVACTANGCIDIALDGQYVTLTLRGKDGVGPVQFFRTRLVVRDPCRSLAATVLLRFLQQKFHLNLLSH